MISKKAINEFKQIYREEYGRELSDKEGLKQGIRLLRLFQVIYRPVDKEWRRRNGYANKKD